MLENDASRRYLALTYFDKAYRQAQIDLLAGKLTGRETSLLPFETIRAQLRQQNPRYEGVKPVPLANIAGSVGRYRDLTRNFLPLTKELRDRWVRVTEQALVDGWPPIELYKIGDVYFVRDGNHRVSSARALNMEAVEAHVWEYSDEVAIGPGDKLDDILIRLGERNFMELTRLDESVPDHDIRFTTPGRYSELAAQIQDLQAKLYAIDGEEMALQDAAVAWYEMIYLPTTQVIIDAQLLREFPGRTTADLFVWMSLMREPLQQAFGACSNLEGLARLLAENYRENGLERISRQVRGLLGNRELPPLSEDVPS
jgi:hypothetical protein